MTMNTRHKLLLGLVLLVALAGCSSPKTSAPSTSVPSSPAAVTSSGPGPAFSPTGTTEPPTSPIRTMILSQPHDGMPGITVTVPASGWGGNPLSKGEEVNDVPEAMVLVWSFRPGTKFFVWGDPCRWRSTRPDTPATTVDEFAAALGAQASRDASKPVDVTIGGYAGKSLTLRVPDDAVFDDCEGGGFRTYGTDEDSGARTQQGPGQVDEFWIVDVDGSIVVFDAMSRPDTPHTSVEEMRSIAQSARFDSRAHVLSDTSDGAIGITVTTPESGWSVGHWGMETGPDGFDPPYGAGIIAFPGVDKKFYVFGDPCKWSTTKPGTPATTVDDLVAALEKQRSRNP